jgi:hypothetical protein
MICAEQLRKEPVSSLDQARYLLAASVDLTLSVLGRDPFQDPLDAINSELWRRLKERGNPVAHVPQRGNPVTQAFDGVTDQELEHELGELAISSGLAKQGSVVHLVVVKRIRAIDAELSRRAEERS